MGENICQFVREVFSGRALSNINKAILCLILKREKPKFINQFRPISLCNVMYKCAMKIIVNHLKSLLPLIIFCF